MGTSFLSLAAGCAREADDVSRRKATALPTHRAADASFELDVERRFTVVSSRIELPGRSRPWKTWAYGGQYPGPEIRLKEGERVRLRLVNPSSATTYHLALAGHRLTVTHADGRPVEPMTVDSLRIGMGERYDVIVEANNPGAHTVMARTVEGDAPPARAVFRYRGSRQTRPPADEVPEGLRGGRRLRYADLQSIETPLGTSGEAARTFDLSLSGGQMGGLMGGGGASTWTIDGQAYPEAAPLQIRKGERVRVRMTNHSMMLHPMHLHGHFFQVGNALKDTVLVDGHMGQAAFEFEADNPGDWLFHCHNLYHLEAGMARAVRYV